MDAGADTWSPDPARWRQRRVAVMGATGFLGAHLTARLVELGADVVVLVRDTVPRNPVGDRWADRVSVVSGAVQDQEVAERFLGEYDVQTVFHLAAQSQVGVANRNPVSTFEANIAGTWSLLEAVRRTSTVTDVVCASSDKAYGSHEVLPYEESAPLLAVHPYDVSKACGDLITSSYHATFGVPVCTTRCGNLFGPGDLNWARIVPSTIRSYLAGEAPVLRSDGTMVRDYLYVVDAADAYLRIAEAIQDDPAVAGEAFNLSLEDPQSVLELVGVIGEVMGVDIPPTVLGIASSEIPAQFLSSAKIRAALGWQPRHDLRAGIAESVSWYRGHLSA